MNHLPWPKNIEFPPLEVPYVCGEEPSYDGLAFSEFPQRRGWSTSDRKHQWMNCSPEKGAIRAQSWLFFGLLDMFLGSRFKKHEWIRHSQRSNTWIVVTDSLPLRLSQIVLSAKGGSLASDFNLSSPLLVQASWNTAFLAANVESQILNIHMNKSQDHNLLLIGLSISILLRSLQRMVDQLTWRDKDVPSMCDLVLDPAKFSLLQMMECNWCEAQAGQFFRLSSPFLNHYLSGLPRPSTSSNHEKCTWERCIGNNVNEEIYEPQHVVPNCSCQFVGPDVRQITDLISANRIPLIRLKVDSGRPELEVVGADRDTPYMSISHVWAGGLGNFRDNTLPTCQILEMHKRLRVLDAFRPAEPSVRLYQFGLPIVASRLLDRIRVSFSQLSSSISPYHAFQSLQQALNPSRPQQSVLFWMDTLCIPVHPDHLSLRLKAIGNMALTYAAAEKCLVLDPELLQIHMRGITATQVNAHMLCSGWVGRSWTFQEARLSRAWYAQFADGLYNPNSTENAALEHRLYSDWNLYKDDAHQLATETMIWYHNMPAIRQTDIYRSQGQQLLHSPLYNFITVWNHLEMRFTSKPEDVHAILANTTDLSAGEVLALPYDQRMRAILRAQPALPTALVYATGQKIKDVQNRWVPAFPDQGYLNEDYGQLTPTDDGYLLDRTAAQPVGFMVDGSAPRYSQLRIIDSSLPGPIWIRFNPEPNGPPIKYEAPGEAVAVCYVMSYLSMSLRHQPIGRPFQGARFALRKQEGKRLHLIYEYSFSYTHESRWLDWDEDEHPIVRAERTDEDAEFLVCCGEWLL